MHPNEADHPYRPEDTWYPSTPMPLDGDVPADVEIEGAALLALSR
jgi:hypothetical protein